MSAQSSLASYDRLADRIRFHRQADKRPLLIVEGVNDKSVLEEVLDDVVFFPAGKRGLAHDAAEVLVARNEKKWAVVSDADFDGGGTSPITSSSRYYPYLGADLEAMLIDAGVLDVVLKNHGSLTKINARGGVSAVISSLRGPAQMVGNLRQGNVTNGWCLTFDGVGLGGKVDKSTLAFDVKAYCHALLRASGASPVTHGALVASARGPSPTLYRGKDLLEVAGAALRKAIGSCTAGAASSAVLESSLRSSSGLSLSNSQWLSGLQSVLAK